MMYPFIKLYDHTEIVHSKMRYEEEKIVKVYIEKPVEDGFKSATCYLPECRWEKIDGFSDEEMEYYRDFVQSISHIIMKRAREV